MVFPGLNQMGLGLCSENPTEFLQNLFDVMATKFGQGAGVGILLFFGEQEKCAGRVETKAPVIQM
jgi:hypothetical protein